MSETISLNERAVSALERIADALEKQQEKSAMDSEQFKQLIFGAQPMPVSPTGTADPRAPGLVPARRRR